MANHSKASNMAKRITRYKNKMCTKPRKNMLVELKSNFSGNQSGGVFNKHNITKRGVVIATICGVILSTTTLVGIINNNERFVFRLVHLLLFWIVHTILLGIICLLLFTRLENRTARNKRTECKGNIICQSFTKGLNERCLIILCWLPYCIMHYPARLGGGSNNQILQFLGEETTARVMSPIIYENHFITNHHPVLLTCFYGIFFKVGNMLGNTNAVIFLLSCFILLMSSFCMAHLLKIVKKHISIKLYIIVLMIVCFYPIFGIYSYTICKDNLFASAFVLFYALLLELSFENSETHLDKWFKLKLASISILIPFLKNQGWLVVSISLFFAGIYFKEMRTYLMTVACAVIIIYVILFSHILMPILKIAPGGKQEALSVPFQQTALYVLRYGEELNRDEYEIIDSVLPVNEIADLYIADIADPVKFSYRQEASEGELARYFMLWVQQFFKHPMVYFEAFFKLTDGYYYIGSEKLNLSLNVYVEIAGASTPDWVLEFQKKEMMFWDFLIHIPVVGKLFYNAIFTWITTITFFYSIYLKEYREMAILIPVLLNLLVCFLSPWNGMMRYMLPVIYSLPFQICILGKIRKC